MTDTGVVKRAYNLIRPLLPMEYAEFNGVRVKAVRKFDRTRSFPEYEAALCDLIDTHLDGGMQVLEVGGGRGVSAVHISRVIGPDGSVTVYEGSHENVELVEDTFRVNDIPSDVDVQNAVVGTPLGLYGEPVGAESIAPTDLPECDALVLDCEGTEIEILAEYLTIRRRSSSRPTIDTFRVVRAPFGVCSKIADTGSWTDAMTRTISPSSPPRSHRCAA